MTELPDEIKNYLLYFSKYERSLNSIKAFPVWENTSYPKTKIQAESMAKFNKIDWVKLFFTYVELLKQRYKNMNELYAKKIIALFILELPIKKYSEEELKKQYRLLSKKYHPDLGGNSEIFNLLQSTRIILSY